MVQDHGIQGNKEFQDRGCGRYCEKTKLKRKSELEEEK